MGTGEFNAGGNPAMDLHPIQGRRRNTSSCFMLPKPGEGLAWWATFGSYSDFTYDVDSDINRICNSLNYNIICPCSLPCYIIHIVLPRVFIVSFYIQLGVMQNKLNSKRAYIQMILRCVI